MQYLVQNKVNYYLPYSKDNIITWNLTSNTVKSFLFPFLYYDNNVISHGSGRPLIKYERQENVKIFNIYNYDEPNSDSTVIISKSDSALITSKTDSELIIPNLFLSFTCSDIMAINNSDSITITVEFKTDVDTVTKKYTYPIKQQFMNTYQIFDYFFVNSLKNIKISATSTIPLTLLPPVNLTEKQYMHYSYLITIHN